MLHWLWYLILAYFAAGAVIFIYGHPKAFLRAKKKALRDREVGDNPVMIGSARATEKYAAHAAQAVNFVTHRAMRTANMVRRRAAESPIDELYAAAVGRAFSEKNFFITTGSPHSRAFYSRNFAWFYPTLLDPKTIVGDEDAARRVVLLTRSLSIIFETMGSKPYTTTLVPLTPKRFAAVNYVKPPSDSLLGVLAGVEMLLGAGTKEGVALFEENKKNLQAQVELGIESLQSFEQGGIKTLLIDRDANRSTATDTRLERRRFVTNANVWASLKKAVRLGLINEDELAARLGGRSLAAYKEELLDLFGATGIIINSLECNLPGAENVVLDFAHVHDGFWLFETPKEIALFRASADAVIGDPRMRDDSGNCFLVSLKNPKINPFEHLAVAAYHGRTVWPAFNVAFAERLIDLAAKTGERRYRDVAVIIMRQLEKYIVAFRGYPEVLDPNGAPYTTWLYHSARADSWFPYFISVRTKLN